VVETVDLVVKLQLAGIVLRLWEQVVYLMVGSGLVLAALVTDHEKRGIWSHEQLDSKWHTRRATPQSTGELLSY